MEEYIYYSDLYDVYKNLLTEKQKMYFKDYYFDNLSFSEIAENYDVSRNAVYNQVKITKNLLDEYEEKLKLKEKFDKIDSLLGSDKLADDIRKIINED